MKTRLKDSLPLSEKSNSLFVWPITRRVLILALICPCLCGCVPKTRADGLYINRKLTSTNATVEDYCKAKGNKEYVVNHKVMFSDGKR